jgi:drug/metabolite transporter (DMT)-like permease
VRTRLGPELQVAGCAAFWGSIGLVVRQIDLSALTIVTYRVAIASITLGLWLLLRPDEGGRRFVVHRPGRTLLQGVTLAVHWVLFFAALQRAPVGLVTLIVFLAPVLMAAVAPFTLGEHLTRRTGAALGLALVGTILLVGVGADGVEVAGLVCAVLAAVLLAVLLINAKVLSPLYGGRRLALAQVTIASVVLIPVAVAGDGAWPSRADLAWVLVLGVVYTGVALAVFLGGLGRIPALHTGVLAYLEPASATFLGWLVLDETLGIGTVIGGILVVAGGLLVLGAPGVEEGSISPEAPGTGSSERQVSDVPG